VNIRSPEYLFFNKVNMVRAEGILIKHLFEVQLIKIGVKMITNEHSAISCALTSVPVNRMYSTLCILTSNLLLLCSRT